MKVWILYVGGDYDTAVFMSLNKAECEKHKKVLAERGVRQSMRIIGYDFNRKKSFELECS